MEPNSDINTSSPIVSRRSLSDFGAEIHASQAQNAITQTETSTSRRKHLFQESSAKWEKGAGVLRRVQNTGLALISSALFAAGHGGVRHESSVQPISPVPVEATAPTHVPSSDVPFTINADNRSSSATQEDNHSPLIQAEPRDSSSENQSPFVGRENMSYQQEATIPQATESTTTHPLEPVHTEQETNSKQSVEDPGEASVLHFIQTNEMDQNTANSSVDQPQNNTGQNAGGLDKLNKSQDPVAQAMEANELIRDSSAGRFGRYIKGIKNRLMGT